MLRSQPLAEETDASQLSMGRVSAGLNAAKKTGLSSSPTSEYSASRHLRQARKHDASSSPEEGKIGKWEAR